ncbi:MAG: DUF6896 domain-containing protein [Isosphaeraceae bacterium]
MPEFGPLWSALRRAALDPPDDLAAAVRALPAAGELPSPWLTWTLIGLVRHRRRQLWVAEVVTGRLGGDLMAIARMGAMGHPPDVPQRGLVPGLTEWEYFFHGAGCCLTHRGTGQDIDVDFFEDSGEYFDEFFYHNFLRSLRHPEPPEARLIELHPSFKPIGLAVGSLLESGVLVTREGRESHPFRVAEWVLDQEEAIDAFCTSWDDPGRRLWSAAVAGDWPAAHALAVERGERKLIELTAGRAEACRSSRRRELLDYWVDERRRSEALMALDDLGAEGLDEILSQALKGPIGGEISRALDIIERRDDPAWCPSVLDLFRRLNPGGELPQPFLWSRCQRVLLRHGYCADEVRASLSLADGNSLGEAALLALEHDPARALPLFRRALRSHIPAVRTTAAAVLALVDRPWSRREMLAVLGETDDQEATADCRAALLECHDEEARQAVEAWERANPHEPEPGPWITMKEMMLRNRPESVRWEMTKRHDRVMKVRDREPGESASPGRTAWDRAVAWIRNRLR